MFTSWHGVRDQKKWCAGEKMTAFDHTVASHEQFIPLTGNERGRVVSDSHRHGRVFDPSQVGLECGE
jgi:hypothetical protein